MNNGLADWDGIYAIVGWSAKYIIPGKINQHITLYSAGSGKERRILEEAASGLAEKESIDFSPWFKRYFWARDGSQICHRLGEYKISAGD